MTATMERIAHEQALRAGIPDVAAYLQALFGQKLTALIAGSREPKSVGQWARGENLPDPEEEQRLRHAFRIARLLAQTEQPQTVRAWFMGMNPQLEDRAPALMVAEDPDRVLKAARSLLAGG